MNKRDYMPEMSIREFMDIEHKASSYIIPRNFELKDLVEAYSADFDNSTKQHGVERIDRDGQRLRRWACSKNLEEPVVTVSNRKVSRRRAALVAQDVQQYGREIFERLYPGYQCVEEPSVRYSDFIAGAYIFARLRRVDAREPWERARQRRRD